jgi:glutamate formiminotransferase/formiminotetrahydrofolate cyclodeaminase
MPSSLLECIPNFSEGRRPDVLQEIEGAIRSVPGVLMLDRHVDPDHNRSVFTFAGPPEAVLEAAFLSIRTAATRIDLNQHRGAHPRIGAADVVPLVPLRGLTLEQAVELARQLGRRVGEELRIPVYLYEAAATRPDRVRLENIRRGEYEALKETIGGDPDRAPDFGPAVLGPAGATVIGARAPLVAFNVYLDSDRVELAKDIARGIRESSGGLASVKALGLLVDGRAQVSMNLTDTSRTSIPAVVEAIRAQAASQGVAIHHSELVGLAPQSSLLEAARFYLQLDPFSAEQVLETRLMQTLDEHGVQASFTDRLAAGTPTPGGGSAAAYAGAMAAALIAMVARLTIGKKKYAEVQARMQAIIPEAEGIRAQLERAVEEDSSAFEEVLAALRLPKGTQEEQAVRAEAMEDATLHAAAVPLEVARRAVQILEWAAEMVETANVNAIADGASAAALARAAFRAATLNVLVNAKSMKDASAAAAWRAELNSLESRAASAEGRVAKELADHA